MESVDQMELESVEKPAGTFCVTYLVLCRPVDTKIIDTYIFNERSCMDHKIPNMLGERMYPAAGVIGIKLLF